MKVNENRVRKLSKSKYILGLQCPKALWLRIHRPELEAPVDADTQHLFDMGNQVGELAQRCFEGGHLISEDHMHLDEAVLSTERAIAEGATAVYEATAAFANTLSRVDILLKAKTDPDVWDLYEVKAATEIKDYYLDDVSFLVSADTVHYGPDFGYSPFGLDAAAHEKARSQDMDIGIKLLSKTVTKTKIQKFTDRVWGEKIPWCGRFSIPFGLLAVQKTVKYSTGNKIVGVPMRYSDSYTLGVLPVFKAGIGTTAPFSLEHWVGYWSIVYGTPQG